MIHYELMVPGQLPAVNGPAKCWDHREHWIPRANKDRPEGGFICPNLKEYPKTEVLGVVAKIAEQAKEEPVLVFVKDNGPDHVMLVADLA